MLTNIFTVAKFLVDKMIVSHLFKKFPFILKNQKVHYRVHNSLKIVPFLSEVNPVHPTSSICILILFFILQLFRLSGV